MQQGFQIFKSYFGYNVQFCFIDEINKKEIFYHFAYDTKNKILEPFSFECCNLLTKKMEF